MSDYVSDPLPEPTPVEEPEPASTAEEEPEPEPEPASAAEVEEPEPEPASAAEEEPEPEPASAAEEEPEPASANEVEAEVEETEPVPASAAEVEEPEPEPEVVVEPEVEESSELTDGLKQRIAELDYLRECCGNWVGSGGRGRKNFLTAWQNKNVSVDATVNYENILDQLEKFPEIVKLWTKKKVNNESNHFKNIESYNLERSLFNEKSVTEKVEVVEQLVTLLTDCANGKYERNKVAEFIDNIY